VWGAIDDLKMEVSQRPAVDLEGAGGRVGRAGSRRDDGRPTGLRSAAEIVFSYSLLVAFCLSAIRLKT
jgi:hypothetical protein